MSIQPFGLALRKRDTDNQFLPNYVPLSEGVHTIIVTGMNGQELSLNFFSGSSWGTLIETFNIPAGAKTFVHTMGVQAGETRTVSLVGSSSTPIGHRATMQVVTLPLYGAGGGSPCRAILILVVAA